MRDEGDRLRYLSTDYTVRDLDQIRAALGDDKLTFLGYSYGTYIGAKYAAAFPDHVRALVLDGAVDPSLDAQAAAGGAGGRVRRRARRVPEVVQHATRRATFHRDGKPATAFDA